MTMEGVFKLNKDMMEDGHIEEAVVEFYKLKKGE